MAKEDTVIVTGFGPFNTHIVNASWEVAKALSQLGIEEELGIRLFIKEIPVSYTCVTNEVPALWTKLKPILVIHLGVSWFAKELTIESNARKSGYRSNDVDGGVPKDGICTTGNCENISTQLNLNQIAQDICDSKTGVRACISHDAGRYLCEFIYYTSLSINETCTLFVHVPDIDKPYSVQAMAQGIKVLIASAIKQLKLISNEV